MSQDRSTELPLHGIRVLELGHVVMGPACGMILADMGAEVVKIERAPDGDDTRRLGGFGVGLFHYFNRNKASLAVDLKQEAGKDVLRRALAVADVLIENYGPGVFDRLGFGFPQCAKLNPRLIYCSLKGFMPGPYERRPSLDNLVQMMGGLAYMTGPSGRPLRAGASVTDILGAAFGVIGILAALRDRDRTGLGQDVTATLYESVAFMVGQHMAQAAITGMPSRPMPEGSQPWAIYDLFETADGRQVFLGIVSDQHWQRFCRAFGFDDMLNDTDLGTNEGRRAARPRLIECIGAALRALDRDEIDRRCESAGVPFAPVRRPDELFDDPHLLAADDLVGTALANGTTARLPKIPLRMGARDFGLRKEPPVVGEGGRPILRSFGLTDPEIDRLAADGVVTACE